MTFKINNTKLLDKLSQQSDQVNHLFEKADLRAVWAAYHAQRPLLIRGKPGTGKSQLAKAIADKLGWAFVSEVLHGSKELEDLHWHYDAINRLGEAQSLAYYSAANQQPPDNKAKPLANTNTVEQKLAHKNFIHPGAFWWAFNWKNASEHCKTTPPYAPKGWDENTGGVVLLLDEIDKAQPDLPNGLLQTLGDLQFTVPYINQPIKADPERLLIIITTNEERELPTALVRRCFVHTLKMQESDDWLINRGKLHFGDKIHEKAYETAAKQLRKDRANDKRYPPGLAEYLDLLRCLSKVKKTEQDELLEDISDYSYNKEARD